MRTAAAASTVAEAEDLLDSGGFVDDGGSKGVGIVVWRSGFRDGMCVDV